MPCCCATDLKAAYVLGIVLAGVNLVPALTLHPPFIAIGILGALVHAVLAFGAFKSHSTAILIWMGLACLSCLGIALNQITKWRGFSRNWCLKQITK